METRIRTKLTGQARELYLERKIKGLKMQRAALKQQIHEQKLFIIALAKLSAPVPMFSNMVIVANVRACRDQILKDAGLWPEVQRVLAAKKALYPRG